MVIKKAKLHTVNFIALQFNVSTTHLLNRNYRFVTTHNKFSKIPPSTSMHFATRV